VSDAAKVRSSTGAAGVLQRARERPVVTIAVLLGGFLLVQWNFFSPHLRFGSSLANYVALLLFFCLPWLGLRYAFALRKWWQITVAVVLLAPVLVYSLLGGIMTIVEVRPVIRTGADPGFAPLAKIEMGAYRVVVYQILDGGAVGGEAAEVRQERTLIPGVLLVRRLEVVDNADISTYRTIGPDELRVELSLWGEKPGQKDFEYHQIGSKDSEYHLKSFVYF